MALLRSLVCCLLLASVRSVQDFDVVIAGGGPLGLATAIHTKQACGCEVAVLEGSTFFNQDGSTTGLSRQTRIAYTTELLTELALNASQGWSKLEASQGVQLINRTGMLWFGNPNTHGSEGQIAAAVSVLERLGLPFESLNSSELMHRFPLKQLPQNYVGLFTPSHGGTMHVPRVMQTFVKLARELGIVLLEHREVESFLPHETGVSVQVLDSSRGDPLTTAMETGKLILCTGPFVNRLLAPLGIAVNMSIWEWSGAYFKTTSQAQWENQPIWIRFENQSPTDGGMFYGFPDWEALGKPGMVRINPGFTNHKFTDPLQRTNEPDAAELASTQQFVANNFVGVDANAMEPATGTCLAAIIADDGNAMVMSHLPKSVPFHKNVVLTTAGWSFKLAPVVGEILAQLALDGESSYANISTFSIEQPGWLLHL